MLDETNIHLAIDVNDDTGFEPEKMVRCSSCEHELTKPSLAIQPHEHTFRNPVGMTFHVALYSDAPGAISVGEPTMLATWFPNYAWSLAICAQCKTHLGWWFHGADKFAGLITNRITT
ncbi:MAG: hypothetical protein JST89_00420 [Cyanobacteria bacterium SZAS-4]|nr:hypothetical protein [Cyanobacteria bacterium SZAS-4]